MATALIGYTGFVGGTLLRQTAFDDLYRSTNIEEIRGRSYDLVVCAGAPAAKWLANKEPEKDLANLKRLMTCLEGVKADTFVLISTIDVYPAPRGVDEDTAIDPEVNHAYGKHRYYLEQFVAERFGNRLIVRLPGLFGKGLKKNFIYDLLNGNALELTHCESVFQFYNMDNLWRDIQRAREHRLTLVNISVEPTKVADVARRSFGVEFANVTPSPPVLYDMHSKYAALVGGSPPYWYSADYTFEAIRAFVREEKKGATA